MNQSVSDVKNSISACPLCLIWLFELKGMNLLDAAGFGTFSFFS